MEDHGADGKMTQAREACRQFEVKLEAYLEGEARPEVTRHAAECAYCGALLADMELVRSVSAELEPAEPPARLWANVRATLVKEGVIRTPRLKRGWRWMLQPAFAGALGALLLVGVWAWRFRPHGTLAPPPPQPAVAALVDPSLVQSMAKMESAFRARAASLDPGMKLAYENGLKSLDTEIQECNTSLVQQPDDALTREYLASAYSEKARVLASALELGDGNGQ
jgi:hypothetical protein